MYIITKNTKLSKTIEELEMQSAMMFQMAHDIQDKATALRRELAKIGTDVSSPSQEAKRSPEAQKEFEAKKARVLFNRKKTIYRSIKKAAAATATK